MFISKEQQDFKAQKVYFMRSGGPENETFFSQNRPVNETDLLVLV